MNVPQISNIFFVLFKVMFISNFDIFAGSVHSDFGNATQGFGNKEEESPIPLES